MSGDGSATYTHLVPGGTSGQYVRITQNNNVYFNLDEVEVFSSLLTFESGTTLKAKPVDPSLHREYKF